MEANKRNNDDKRKKRRRKILLFIIAIIILLLILFGCKVCNNNRYNHLLNSLPKINEDGYWVDKNNNKINDKKNDSKGTNAYDYYKKIDPSYDKSPEEFIKDFEDKKLPKLFKVEFFNEGSLYHVKNDYKFFDKVLFPSNPVKEGYNFEGWKLLDGSSSIFTNSSNVLVDGDYKFESVFKKDNTPPEEPEEKDKYTLKFYVDGEIYKEVEIKKNHKIEHFDAPEKEGYAFLGWYDQYGNKFDFNKEVNKDLTLTAKYHKIVTPDSTIKHKVNYFDEDGNIYKVIEVANNEKAINIEGKFKAGYHLSAWLDKDDGLVPFDFNTLVTKSYNLVPKYEINTYKIEFEGEGVINLPSTIHDIDFGTSPEAPDTSSMSKPGYTFENKFIDHDGNEFIFGTTKIKKDLTLTPSFKINKYTVTWKNYDGTTLYSEQLEHGTTPSYSGSTPVKPNVGIKTYTFAGWDKSLSPITEDTVYTAIFNESNIKHTVTWKNYDGTTLTTTQVEHGSMPVYSGIPTKPSTATKTYTFAGWSPALAPVTGDTTTYTATYTEATRKYTINWNNYDGTTLATQQYEYHQTPVFGLPNPTRPNTINKTYTFAGWDSAVTAVDGDKTYTATYTEANRKYTITWNNHDGSEI
ncbi:MAG: InlB B-repeat-containing protein, partial [Bacillales bacterium]